MTKESSDDRTDAYTTSAKYYDKIYLSKADEMYDNTLKDFYQVTSEVIERDLTSVIDVGCGTGNHAIRLAQDGLDVLGIDQSPYQLAIAREKSAELGLKINFLEADMSKIPPVSKQYDAAAAFFSGFCYLLNDQDVLAFLNRMDELIVDDGLLYFEFWHILAVRDSSKHYFRDTSGELSLLRYHTNQLDPISGIVTMPMHHIIWKGNEIIEDFTETHQLRTYSMPHLKSLIDQTPWRIHEIFGEYYNKGKEVSKPSVDDFRLYAVLVH